MRVFSVSIEMGRNGDKLLAETKGCEKEGKIQQRLPPWSKILQWYDNPSRHVWNYIHDFCINIVNIHYMELSNPLNLMFSLVCMNSDELTGFDLSHNGYWSHGRTSKGSKNVKECALSCLQDCVAFETSATSAHSCFHYQNRNDTINANARYDSAIKAYIKCAGRFEGKLNISRYI